MIGIEKTIPSGSPASKQVPVLISLGGCAFKAIADIGDLEALQGELAKLATPVPSQMGAGTEITDPPMAFACCAQTFAGLARRLGDAVECLGGSVKPRELRVFLGLHRHLDNDQHRDLRNVVEMLQGMAGIRDLTWMRPYDGKPGYIFDISFDHMVATWCGPVALWDGASERAA